jgi:hypothetical protein
MKGFRSHHHPPSLDFFLAQHPKTYTAGDMLGSSKIEIED